MLLSKILLSLFFVFCRNTVCLSDDNEVPEVTTPSGKLSGSWKTSFEDRKFASFEGIPYAVPPVGELRFEEPQPLSPWTGVWQATETHSCPQQSMVNAGNEDCLYLNVYVPTATMDHKKKFDVLVIIHGGAFMMGNGHQMAKAQFLMDRDIIVTINYRLGILGFLSTGDEAIPGNNGMKDQVLALRWVKENIASFGGNPDAITISGLSAGGASVHLHYFSPLSKDLFIRGIAQSGTALDPWVIRRKPIGNARRLGASLGCEDGSTEHLKKCLKQRPVSMILDKQKDFHGFGQMPFSPFGPVIEKKSKHAFLSEEPFTLLKERRVLDVPIIISNCANEGLLPTAWYYADLENIDSKWPEIAHHALDYNNTLPLSKREKAAKEILDFYLGPEKHITEDTFKNFTKIFTERLFGIGAEISAKLQSKANKSPVYFYYFNYQKGENRATSFFSQKPIEGVSHGEDGIYFYGFLMFKEFSKRDLELRKICHDMLYSYATTGKPFVDGTDEWQPTEGSELTYLNITDVDDIKLQTTKTLVSADFWRRIGVLEHEAFTVKEEL